MSVVSNRRLKTSLVFERKSSSTKFATGLVAGKNVKTVAVQVADPTVGAMVAAGVVK